MSKSALDIEIRATDSASQVFAKAGESLERLKGKTGGGLFGGEGAANTIGKFFALQKVINTGVLAIEGMGVATAALGDEAAGNIEKANAGYLKVVDTLKQVPILGKPIYAIANAFTGWGDDAQRAADAIKEIEAGMKSIEGRTGAFTAAAKVAAEALEKIQNKIALSGLEGGQRKLEENRQQQATDTASTAGAIQAQIDKLNAERAERIKAVSEAWNKRAAAEATREVAFGEHRKSAASFNAPRGAALARENELFDNRIAELEKAKAAAAEGAARVRADADALVADEEQKKFDAALADAQKFLADLGKVWRDAGEAVKKEYDERNKHAADVNSNAYAKELENQGKHFDALWEQMKHDHERRLEAAKTQAEKEAEARRFNAERVGLAKDQAADEKRRNEAVNRDLDRFFDFEGPAKSRQADAFARNDQSRFMRGIAGGPKDTSKDTAETARNTKKTADATDAIKLALENSKVTFVHVRSH